MCARWKTCLLLSLALHLAVLAWASPARKPPIAAGAPAARWDATMVELPAPAASKARAMPPLKEEADDAAEPPRKDSPSPPLETEPQVAGGPTEGAGAAAAMDAETGPGGNVPVRIVRSEEFARLSYIREMTAKTTSYYRSAPKGFEGILRSALPSDALRENGKATVSLGFSPSGELGDVDIRSDSPALLSALRLVPWETAPLPSRYRIPCSKVELTVSIVRERLAVGLKIL